MIKLIAQYNHPYGIQFKEWPAGIDSHTNYLAAGIWRNHPALVAVWVVTYKPVLYVF